MEHLKVGDRVRTKNPNDILYLRHRKNRNGIITTIDGSYIDVKPMWCDWVYEAYPNELEKV